MNICRGEVMVGTSGYTLVCDFNALCAIEGHFGGTVESGLERIEAGTLELQDLRFVVAALLSNRHPEVGLLQAGDLITTHLGDIRALVALAIHRAMPALDPEKKPLRRKTAQV